MGSKRNRSSCSEPDLDLKKEISKLPQLKLKITTTWIYQVPFRRMLTSAVATLATSDTIVC